MPNRICSTSLNEDAKNQSHFESCFYPLSMHKRKLRLLSTFVGGLARSFFQKRRNFVPAHRDLLILGRKTTYTTIPPSGGIVNLPHKRL